LRVTQTVMYAEKMCTDMNICTIIGEIGLEGIDFQTIVWYQLPIGKLYIKTNLAIALF